jgi:hypothetical protein
VAVKKKEKREQSINRFYSRFISPKKVLAKNKKATTTRLRDEERQSFSREPPI